MCMCSCGLQLAEFFLAAPCSSWRASTSPTASRNRQGKENNHKKLQPTSYDDILKHKLQADSNCGPVHQERNKKEELRRELEEKEMRECTFSPRVHAAGSTRSIEEFLGQEVAHTHSRNSSS